MKIKKEMLEEATKTNYGDLDLYLSNSSQPQPSTKQEMKPAEIIVPKEETKVKSDVEAETPQEILKMISLRLPESLLDKIIKYSYVVRRTQKDVIIEGIKSIVESEEGQQIIAEYDKIKNGEEN